MHCSIITQVTQDDTAMNNKFLRLPALACSHWRSQTGGLRGLGPQRMKNIYQSYSLVNLTINMRYKNDKQYQICHHQIRFFQLKMHQNLFSAERDCAPDPAGGAYDAPPNPLVGWGVPSPLDAFGASVLRPPQHKILATPVHAPTPLPLSRPRYTGCHTAPVCRGTGRGRGPGIPGGHAISFSSKP